MTGCVPGPPLHRVIGGAAGACDAPVTGLRVPGWGCRAGDGSGPAYSARVRQQPDRRGLVGARLAALRAVLGVVVQAVLAVVLVHGASFPLGAARKTATDRFDPFPGV